MSKDIDRDAAWELILFIENDGQLYESEWKPIAKSLMRKRAKGDYDSGKAVNLFMYLTESGAKKYAREVSGGGSPPWHVMFNLATRREAAREMTRAFERRADLGEHDHLGPGVKLDRGRTSGKSPMQLEREIRAALKAPAKRRR